MQAKHPAGKTRFPDELRPDYVLTILLFVSFLTLGFNDFKKPMPPAPNVTTEIRFNEGTGTTAADGSGNGHTATLTNGPTWVAGKYGQAVNLDGTNDYLAIADHANFTLDP